MGYDWKGWSVLLYILGAAFAAFQVVDPATLGLTGVQYHWIMFILGIATVVAAKFGASWAGKTTNGITNGVAKLLIPFVIFGALSTAACKPPASIQTEPGRQAWYASQVLQRVQEVQNIAIRLNATTPPTLSTNTTRIIVQFCVSSAKVLKEMPEGWAKVVLAAFNETKAQLPADALTNTSLQSALAVLEGLLVTFAGGTP